MPLSAERYGCGNCEFQRKIVFLHIRKCGCYPYLEICDKFKLMNHIERFYATLERRRVDRSASWLGIPDPEALPGLFSYFGVSNVKELKKRLDDDIYPVEIPYHPVAGDPSREWFPVACEAGPAGERRLTVPGLFADCSSPADVDRFPWPDPSSYIDPAECRRVVGDIPDGYAVLGVVWSTHFEDACTAFGMENALIRMMTDPAVFRAVIDRIVDFYLKANEIFYSATRGKLHAVLIGNDFGSQMNLMVAPDMLREFVFEGTRKLIAQAKSYGLKVVHHSCGCIFDVIPDLIGIGADVIHPIQALAAKMEPPRLKKAFGNQISFCGGVDAQRLLVSGTPDDVRRKVRELRELFPTGLIFSPSHEEVLPDVSPANLEAMFDALR